MYTEVVDKYFSFDHFMQMYKKLNNSEKKKTRRINPYAFYMSLYEPLCNGSYKPKRYNCFYVSDPSTREIFSPHFDDRIVHHLVVSMLSFIEDNFIEDSFANRDNMGTHKAIEKSQLYIRQIPQKNCYYMQCDVKSYFSSINKHILFKIYFKHINKQNLPLLEKKFIVYLLNTLILQNPAKNPNLTGRSYLLKKIPKEKSLFHQPPNIGLPIGSFLSQFNSLVYLNELDHFIKNELKIKRYIRYVDDFVIFSNTTKDFKQIREKIQNFLNQNLNLKLNPKKTKIQNITKGLDFLGYIIRPHYLLVRKRTINNLKNRLRFFNYLINPNNYNPKIVQTYFETLKLSKLYLNNLLKPKQQTPSIYLLQSFLQTINSYYGIISYANTYNIRVSIYNNYFKALKEYFYPKNSFRAFGIRPIIHGIKTI